MRLRSKEEIEGEEDREGKRINVLVRLDEGQIIMNYFWIKVLLDIKHLKPMGLFSIPIKANKPWE